jgi:hypothetical protein
VNCYWREQPDREHSPRVSRSARIRLFCWKQSLPQRRRLTQAQAHVESSYRTWSRPDYRDQDDAMHPRTSPNSTIYLRSRLKDTLSKSEAGHSRGRAATNPVRRRRQAAKPGRQIIDVGCVLHRALRVRSRTQWHGVPSGGGSMRRPCSGLADDMPVGRQRAMQLGEVVASIRGPVTRGSYGRLLVTTMCESSSAFPEIAILVGRLWRRRRKRAATPAHSAVRSKSRQTCAP